jgi:hypothetical protein
MNVSILLSRDVAKNPHLAPRPISEGSGEPWPGWAPYSAILTPEPPISFGGGAWSPDSAHARRLGVGNRNGRHIRAGKPHSGMLSEEVASARFAPFATTLRRLVVSADAVGSPRDLRRFLSSKLDLSANRFNQADCLLGRPQGVCHEPPIHKRRLITVSFFIGGSRRGVPYHRHFKAVLDEVPHMRFNA